MISACNMTGKRLVKKKMQFTNRKDMIAIFRSLLTLKALKSSSSVSEFNSLKITRVMHFLDLSFLIALNDTFVLLL